MQLGWRRLSRTARAILAGVTAVALCSAPISFPATASAAAKATGTVITTAPGPFGTQLVVGSGKYAGYSLYLLTSDQPSSSVCTATIIKTLPGGPGSCAGPSNDQKAEWPAITTNGSPVAGAGVQESLLGVRTRPGIGVQITYAGHLLYLFDQGPGQVLAALARAVVAGLADRGTLGVAGHIDNHAHRWQGGAGCPDVHWHRLGTFPRLLLYQGQCLHQHLYGPLCGRLAAGPHERESRGGELRSGRRSKHGKAG